MWHTQGEEYNAQASKGIASSIEFQLQDKKDSKNFKQQPEKLKNPLVVSITCYYHCRVELCQYIHRGRGVFRVTITYDSLDLYRDLLWAQPRRLRKGTSQPRPAVATEERTAGKRAVRILLECFLVPHLDPSDPVSPCRRESSRNPSYCRNSPHSLGSPALPSWRHTWLHQRPLCVAPTR